MKTLFTFDDIEAKPHLVGLNGASGALWEFRKEGRYKCQLFFKDRTTKKRIIMEYYSYQIEALNHGN